jgi:hypothetical protein
LFHVQQLSPFAAFPLSRRQRGQHQGDGNRHQHQASRQGDAVDRHGSPPGRCEAAGGRSAASQSEAEDETGNGNRHQEFAHGQISPSGWGDFGPAYALRIDLDQPRARFFYDMRFGQ